MQSKLNVEEVVKDRTLKQVFHDCCKLHYHSSSPWQPRPTDQFKDFPGYIHYMELNGAHLGGIAKIVPPAGWNSPRADFSDLQNRKITPLYQTRGSFVRVEDPNGCLEARVAGYELTNTEEPDITPEEFRRLAADRKLVKAPSDDPKIIEDLFWTHHNPSGLVYGSVASESLFYDSVELWNLKRLPSLLNVLEENNVLIEGVNTPYLYVGMWGTAFAWHVEDYDLYSINYLHCGQSKFWYSIPPDSGRLFERQASEIFPLYTCEAFLRHKATMIWPELLRSRGVPVDKIEQKAGEIIVTFPYGYHSGFNAGLNVAEAVNFATERWIPYGMHASRCRCRGAKPVTINMKYFHSFLEPPVLQSWRDGTSRHPEDWNSGPLPKREVVGCATDLPGPLKVGARSSLPSKYIPAIDGRYVCYTCGKDYTKRHVLNSHITEMHLFCDDRFVVCDLCGINVNRFHLDKHVCKNADVRK